MNYLKKNAIKEFFQAFSHLTLYYASIKIAERYLYLYYHSNKKGYKTVYHMNRNQATNALIHFQYMDSNILLCLRQ
jgi:hypothetical protein